MLKYTLLPSINRIKPKRQAWYNFVLGVNLSTTNHQYLISRGIGLEEPIPLFFVIRAKVFYGSNKEASLVNFRFEKNNIFLADLFH